MRIDPHAIVSRIQGVRLRNVSQVEEPGATGTDSVEFSSRAADVRVAMEALRDAPAVRQDKVAELRQQLEQGGLEMDLDALAGKLLEQK